MAVIRFKTNILRKDKPDRAPAEWCGQIIMRTGGISMPHVSQSPHTSPSPAWWIYLFCVRIYNIYMYRKMYAQGTDAAHWLLSRSSQLPSRSKLSISIGYNDALVYNYWILRRTAGYIAAPDLKGKKKRARSCMKVATAMSGKERSAALSRPLYRQTIDSRSIATYVELSRQLFFYSWLDRSQLIDLFAVYIDWKLNTLHFTFLCHFFFKL